MIVLLILFFHRSIFVLAILCFGKLLLLYLEEKYLLTMKIMAGTCMEFLVSGVTSMNRLRFFQKL